MHFLVSFYRSLSNLTWLKQQKHATGAAWKYFLLFAVLLTLASAIPLVASFPAAVRELKDKVMSNVPDFQATLKQGTLSVVGFPQPYIYRDKESGFVFVVDTFSTSSVALANYLKEDAGGGIRIGKDEVEMVDSLRGETRTQTWKNFPDYSITKAGLIQKITAYSGPGMAALIMGLVLILAFFGIALGKLWSILFVSLIAYIVSAVARRGWKWGELFVVGLYATTLPSIIAVAFALFRVQIGFVHFLALLAFMLAVVLTKEERTIEDSTSSGK
ncbi:MAG: DUF1189 family protein [Candidatus Magasanikbacteria bacterium]|nr:DUF1189 family protein [Candidatus Magasanikbacteria bacterium]